MTNHQKLERLFLDVFLLDASEYRLDLQRVQVDTWDSLGIVSLGVGIEETFGYHPTPQEARALASVPDVIALLESKGILFDG
jgi:acyl carrier protein